MQIHIAYMYLKLTGEDEMQMQSLSGIHFVSHKPIVNKKRYLINGHALDNIVLTSMTKAPSYSCIFIILVLRRPACFFKNVTAYGSVNLKRIGQR